MSCDIIIPVFNQRQYTQDCLNSIKKNTLTDYRIIIVDDKSIDLDSLKFLSGINDTNIKIIHNQENLGWVKSVNRGIEESSAEYVCVMNNDTLVSSGWLSEMIAVAEKEPDIGLVNPEWEKPGRVSIEDYARSLKKYSGEFIETDWVRGFCFLVKKEVIDKIGGLDEAYSPGYYDDCDFSMRAIKAGFRCVRAKRAYVYHYRNKTHADVLRNGHMALLLEKHKQIFYERWGRPLRLVFIFTKKITDRKAVEDMLFSLARQQHHIYIWASTKDAPRIKHTNVRVNIFPKILFGLFVLVNIVNNIGRNISKKYNAIFANDAGISGLLLFFGLGKKAAISLMDFNSAGIGQDIIRQVESIKNEREIIRSNYN